MKFEKLGIGHIHRYDIRNHNGRIFHTTDVHGNFNALHHELRQVVFDTSKDILFVGGDNTDRNIDSKYILDYINEPWYISIQGNHESLYIEGFESHWHPNNRSVLTLKAHGGEWIWGMSDLEKILIHEAFSNLPVGIELIGDDFKIGITHAETPYNDWDQFVNITQAEFDWDGKATAQWARRWYSAKYQGCVKGVDLVLCGHTPTDSGEIEKLGNMIFCDGGSFFRDKVNLVEINSEFVRSMKNERNS